MEGLWEAGSGNFVVEQIVEIREEARAQVDCVLGVPASACACVSRCGCFCVAMASVYLWNRKSVSSQSKDRCYDVVVAGWCSELMKPRSKA